MSPRGVCTWKIALKYRVKQSKNGKFTFNYKASLIDLKRKFASVDSVDKSLRIEAPKNKPLKKGLWKILAPGLMFGILRYFYLSKKVHDRLILLQ